MFRLTETLAAALLVSVSAETLREGPLVDEDNRRELQAGYAFLVSDVSSTADWCITATNGVGNNANLGFRPCDFTTQPTNQLWQLDSSGSLHSAVNADQCMIINFGSDIFDGVRVRMNSCSPTTAYNQFSHNGSRDQIKSKVDSSYCLTNRGVTADNSDTIHAKPCTNAGRFFFTYTPATSSTDQNFAQLATDGGCLVVRDGTPRADQMVILGTCTGISRWRIDSDGTFRAQGNNNMCLQAGRGATPATGTKMRTFPCDASSALQKFTLGADGKAALASNTALCVDHRGGVGNVGSDPIILKPCGNAGVWTAA